MSRRQLFQLVGFFMISHVLLGQGLGAQEDMGMETMGVKVGKGDDFDVNTVIAPRVKDLPRPKLRPGSVGVAMESAVASERVQAHVQQGFSLIYAQWDFEAYRHFCAAIQEDKDCLLAYCGVALALAQPFSEDSEYRRVAVERMLNLMEVDTEAIKLYKPISYSAIEKQFCAATATLLTDSPVRAGALFLAIGETFPRLLQAKLLGIFMNRGSYDISGRASQAQLHAIEQIKNLVKQHGDNPLVLGFWVSLCAEAPNQAVHLKKEVLPQARKLVQIAPEMPSWWHAVGHLEWRVGNYLLAERAFKKASELYILWMEESGLDLNDCPGLIKTKCYLANTLYHRGDFTGAMKIAEGLRALDVDITRPRSPGNGILLWRGHTLAARLYIAHGARGSMERGMASLPLAEELLPFTSHSKFPTLAGAYIGSLRIYMGCRKAIEDRELEEAKVLHEATFKRYFETLLRVLKGARRTSDARHYTHASKSLAIYDKELKGFIGMNGDEDTRQAAVGSFYSARDLQYIPSLMDPPMVITPMQNRLGQFYLQRGDQVKAYQAFSESHESFPNNLTALEGMKYSLNLMGKRDEAARVQRHIDLVRAR